MQRISILQGHLAEIESDTILTECRDNCIKIIFNRPPQKLNSINAVMRIELLKAIEEANQGFKVCILKPASKCRAFCVGGDLIEVAQLFINNRIKEAYLQFSKIMFEMAKAKPLTIAFWDGIVMGGGAGLSINCNIKIATENTVFGMPEAKVGFITDAGASYFLSRLRKNIGLFLAMTAYPLKGKEAYQVGVADYFVKSSNLTALEEEIERISQMPIISEAKIRETVEKYAEKVSKRYDEEDLIAKIFEGQDLYEVLEKLKQESLENTIVRRWYKDILQSCPLSHFYNFELLKRGKTLNLHEALSLEAYVALRANQEELFEGIHSRFIEKGAEPNWKLKLEDLKNFKAEELFPKEIKLLDYRRCKKSVITTESCTKPPYTSISTIKSIARL